MLSCLTNEIRTPEQSWPKNSGSGTGIQNGVTESGATNKTFKTVQEIVVYEPLNEERKELLSDMLKAIATT